MSIRRSEDTVLKKELIGIKDRVNGDVVIPLTDVKGEPVLESPVPQIISDAIDATAMQASSTGANIYVPALDPSDDASLMRAMNHKMGLYACWYDSRWDIKQRRAYRQLAGYGLFAAVAVPDMVVGAPRIQLRDPLTAYPDRQSPEEIRCPSNVGFVVGRSPDWIKKYYPESEPILRGTHHDLWDLVEWIDEDQCVIGILGPRNFRQVSDDRTIARNMLLRRWDNKAGIVPAVIPARVTLDRIASQVSKIVGITDLMARLMALDFIATEKAVFPDRYLIAREGRSPIIVGGRWKDGREGATNILEGIDKIGELNSVAGPMTGQVIDRLERAARMSGGTPGVFGGELTGAIRSGQTVSQVGHYAVDPRVQEMQQIMEYSLTELNNGVREIYKGYWGAKQYSFYSGRRNDISITKMTPNVDMEVDHNQVSYSMTGMDINNQVLALGQSLSEGVISLWTAMGMHPFVDDPQFERQERWVERAEEALFTGVMQRAAAGEFTETDTSALVKYLRSGMRPEMAMERVQKEAQARQAQEAPQPQPGQVAAPETQPGTANAGMGAEQPSPMSGLLPQEPADLDVLRRTMGALRTTSGVAR